MKRLHCELFCILGGLLDQRECKKNGKLRLTTGHYLIKYFVIWDQHRRIIFSLKVKQHWGDACFETKVGAQAYNVSYMLLKTY